MIFPEYLKEGDKIAIVSTASAVKEEYIDGAAETLRREGFVPVIAPHAKGPANGSYASSAENRLKDFSEAWADPEIKAVLCARGGYGCVHLLENLSQSLDFNQPKWLIGFSDISALHALLASRGVASLHSPMAKHLALNGSDDSCTKALFDILRGNFPINYKAEPDSHNIQGECSGILSGGNMAVLDGLSATPFDIFSKAAREKENGPGSILFIEDIAEPIYKIERMLYRLFHQGVLERINGLIVGQFTEWHPDKNYDSPEDMISDFLKKHKITIPTAFNFPVGHVDLNYPVVEGARAQLSVGPNQVSLTLDV